MARAIDLTSVIESDAKQIYEEYSIKHAYPSLVDGLCNVNRSILYAFMKDYKGEATKAEPVASHVQAKYHLHSAKSIHRTALMMASERLPLITAYDNNRAVYSNREGIIAGRYLSYYKTRWGEYVHQSVANAQMVKNYSLTQELPAFYPTMLPYMLFTNYTNINVGVTNNTLPFNPNEIFSMMRVLLRNPNVPIEELLNFFKGPDIGPNYTVVGHPQSRYALLKDGYGKFDVLTNMEFTRDTILFKDVPYRSSRNKFLNILQDLKLDTAVLGTPNKRASTRFVMSITYKLNEGYTVKDLQKELYIKTTLKKTIAVELVGFHPKNEGNVTDGQLDIMGIKEMLINSLNYGYANRVRELNDEIQKVWDEVEHESLIEKLTREEVKPWVKQLIYGEISSREDVLYKRGNAEIGDFQLGQYIKVKGGISWSEVRATFARTNNNIMPNLDTRDSTLSRLQALDDRLVELHQELEPLAIYKYLDSVIDDWMKDPVCERQSQILFTNIETAITTQCEATEKLIMSHMLTVSDNVDIPVNFIFYKDGTIEYWNPEKSVSMPKEMLSKEIHSVIKCRTTDTLLIFTSARRFKTKVKYLINNISEYNKIYSNENILFQGVLVYEWNIEEPNPDDFLFIVTSMNRIKKMTVSSILQKFQHVKPLPLYKGEFVKYAKVIHANELDKYTIEVLTERGIKRRALNNLLVKGLKGFVTLVGFSYERDIVDFRFCKDEPNVTVLEDGTLKVVDVDVEEVHKRDLYKEVIVEEEGKYNHYIQNKEYYNEEGEIVTPQQAFGLEESVEIDGVLTAIPDNVYHAFVQTSKTRQESEEVES